MPRRRLRASTSLSCLALLIACGDDGRSGSASGPPGSSPGATRDAGMPGIDASADAGSSIDAGGDDAGGGDAGDPGAARCGDAVCQPGENAANCASDCGYTPAADSRCTDLLAPLVGAADLRGTITSSAPRYTNPFRVEKRVARHPLELDASDVRELRLRFDASARDLVDVTALSPLCGLYPLTRIFEETIGGELAWTYLVEHDARSPGTVVFQIEHLARATPPLDYRLEVQPARCRHPSVRALAGTLAGAIEASDPERLFRGNRFDVYAFDVGATPRRLTLDALDDGLYVNVFGPGPADSTGLDAGDRLELTAAGRVCVEVNESSPEAASGATRAYRLSLTP